MSFTRQHIVEFQHCDPAGIVFYPRYFEMISSTVERFFTDALGADFGDMHVTRRMGVPMARIEVDFTAPSRLGDRLAFELDVAHVSGSSATLAITCRCGDQVRFRAKGTIVYVDLATGRPVRWPPGLRAALTGFLAG